MFRRGTGRPHPPAHSRLPPSRRGLPQAVVALEHLLQQAASRVWTGGEDQRTAGRRQAGLNCVQDLDVRICVGCVHIPEGSSAISCASDEGRLGARVRASTPESVAHGRKISLAADDVSPGRGPPEIT
jgi:hypothetical protein